MAEILADVLKNSSGVRLAELTARNRIFTESEIDILHELGYVEKGFWYAKDNRMVSKMELGEAIARKEVAKPNGNEYPLQIFMFNYNAKWKSILPIWDRNPVAIMTGSTGKGFKGINIHFIDYNERMMMLDYINHIIDSGESMNSAMRLIQSYDHAAKSYLNTHIMSNITAIPRSMWAQAFETPGDFVTKGK